MAVRKFAKFASPSIAPRAAAATVLAALALAGCASSGRSLNVDGKKVAYKDEISVFSNPASEADGLDPVAAAAFWGAQYDRDRNNPDVAVNYAAALRKMGSINESVNVIIRAADRHRDNPNVNLEAGKALTEGGRAFEAIRYFEEAVGQDSKDWRALSAYGVALDQIGEHKLARVKYDTALVYSPRSPQILSNKGLSYALQGDLEQASAFLREAASIRGSDARVRQNLALVLAIKGELREAERLARSDLPPQIADHNIDYFRTLMKQPAYWQDFAADNLEPAPFAETPAKPAEAPAAPALKLREEPKPAAPAEPETPAASQGSPVALGGVTAPTNASADGGVELKSPQ